MMNTSPEMPLCKDKLFKAEPDSDALSEIDLDLEDCDANTTTSKNHELEGDLKLAKHEDKWVFRLRFLTTLILISAAVAVCLVVYTTGRGGETLAFEQDFKALGQKLVSSFESTVEQRFGIIQSFTEDITSDANGSWPFVVPPHFHERAETMSMLAQSMWTRLMPRVSRMDLDAWTEFSWVNQGWRTRALARQLDIPEDEVHAQTILPQMMNFHNPNGPTPAIEINPEGPYYPLWCVYPAANKSIENLDLYGDIEHAGNIDTVVATGKPVFETSYDYLLGQEKDLRYQFMTQAVYIDYLDDPHGTIFFPSKQRMSRLCVPFLTA
jgi:hypothetical protein